MKFTIVTPTFNSERYISPTIESVLLQQGCFNIDYIVVDNYSTDSTVDIVRRYQHMISDNKIGSNCNQVTLRLIVDHDEGMYDAINKGFSQAQGDVLAWINSDDIYLPGAFDCVMKALTTFPDVTWIKGTTSYVDLSSRIYEVGKCYLYYRNWINRGIYGRYAYFIQQDSVFWRAQLWNQVGGIDRSLKRAGDYYLWIRFSELTPLISLKYNISCFRKVEGQLSQDVAGYRAECQEIAQPDQRLGKKIQHYFQAESRIPPRLRPYYYLLTFGHQKLRYVFPSDNACPIMKYSHYYLA